MTSGPDASRRDFLSTSARALGGGWITANLPLLASLAACARDAAERGEPFTTLTDSEAAAMRAFAALILPSDGDLPGAEEAGAVYFVDRALAGPFAGMLPPIRAGLADLDRRARDDGAVSFAALPEARQTAHVREIESGPFFFPARMLVVIGVFADPAHGGNREGAGWRILDVDHAGAYQPPFGYYDAEAGGAA